jgi:hypothetical protein
MTLAEVVAHDERPTLTAIVRARMMALDLTQATLARRMAPRWQCSPDSAVATLSRWFNRALGGKGDMTTDKLAELLAELGLVVVAAP